MNIQKSIWGILSPLVIGAIIHNLWWHGLSMIIEIPNFVLGLHHNIHHDYWMGHRPEHGYLIASFAMYLPILYYSWKKSYEEVKGLQSEMNTQNSGPLIWIHEESVVACPGLGCAMALSYPFIITSWDFSWPHYLYIFTTIAGLTALGLMIKKASTPK